MKALTLELSLDISKCVEKIDLVELTLEARVSSDCYYEKYEHWINENISNGKTLRRRSKVDPGIWKNVFPEDVEELLFNIDGTCVFHLNFQKDERMKSTKDGRPWNAWVTSNSKAYPGVRRKTTCSASFKCANWKCMFRQY